MEDGKVRKAKEGEVPFGAVSPASAVIGDGDIGRWKGKYLKDDFGRNLMEEYSQIEWTEIVDGKEVFHTYQFDMVPLDIIVPEDAKIISEDDKGEKLMRRKLNPDYVEGSEYVSREDRPEWELIGLIGKVRIFKGQPVDPRWIKMRDISDKVEEWLIK
jgi:hypothetical protein